MKFHFNGGLDCPEWILSQIPELSKTDKAVLEDLCISIIERLESGKVEWTEPDLRISSMGLLDADALRMLKAKIAAISFIFEKASKNDCSEKDLGKEMLQLGLPSEQVSILAKIYENHFEKLKSNLIETKLIKASSFAIHQKEALEMGGSEHSNSYIRMQTLSSDGKAVKLIIGSKDMSQLKHGIESATGMLEAMMNEK